MTNLFTGHTIEQTVVDWLKDFGAEFPFDGSVRTLASRCDTLLPKLMRGEGEGIILSLAFDQYEFQSS